MAPHCVNNPCASETSVFGPVDAVATTGASIDNSVPVSVTLVETILSGFDVISTGPFRVSQVRGQLPCAAAESASESASADLQPARENPATKTADDPKTGVEGKRMAVL